MSHIQELAGALTTRLQGVFPGEEITFSWIPDFEKRHLASRAIFVTPDTRETEIIGRGCTQTRVGVMVGILEPKRQGHEDAQVKAIHSLVDEAINELLGKTIGGAVVMTAEHTTTLSSELWREKNLIATFFRFDLEI